MLTKEQMQDLQDRISFVFPEDLEFFVVLHDPKSGKAFSLTSANPPQPMVSIVRHELDKFDADGKYNVIDTDAAN
jgi:hypothetical protein